MRKMLTLATNIVIGLSTIVGCSGRSDASGGTDTGVTEVAEAVSVPTFSGDSAMSAARRQVTFGPRVPGTAAHRACADWLSATLSRYGAVVVDTIVTARNPVTGAAVPVRNIMASFAPEKTSRVMLLAHYDTRPWADEDPDAGVHNIPIDGANDGASGVAVALEVARLVGQKAPAIGVDILLVDQEDSGTSPDEGMDPDLAARYEMTWCIGSRAWAEARRDAAHPRYAILLDMVGGRNAVFAREFFSNRYAGHIVDLVWREAARAGYGDRFINSVGGGINDDHISLLNIGIPTIDIIDIGNPDNNGGGFNATWHTLDDNIENLDPETMRIVGDVVTRVIYNEKP